MAIIKGRTGKVIGAFMVAIRGCPWRVRGCSIFAVTDLTEPAIHGESHVYGMQSDAEFRGIRWPLGFLCLTTHPSIRLDARVFDIHLHPLGNLGLDD